MFRDVSPDVKMVDCTPKPPKSTEGMHIGIDPAKPGSDRSSHSHFYGCTRCLKGVCQCVTPDENKISHTFNSEPKLKKGGVSKEEREEMQKRADDAIKKLDKQAVMDTAIRTSPALDLPRLLEAYDDLECQKATAETLLLRSKTIIEVRNTQIEELEAKLGIAVEALEKLGKEGIDPEASWAISALSRIRP